MDNNKALADIAYCNDCIDNEPRARCGWPCRPRLQARLGFIPEFRAIEAVKALKEAANDEAAD